MNNLIYLYHDILNEVVKLLPFKHGRKFNCTKQQYNYIQYYYNTKQFNYRYINNLIDWASNRGYLEVIKYLHLIGKECTLDALNRVSNYGHLEVVKYLHSIGKECTLDALNNALNCGYFHIVKFLREKYNL